MDIHEIIVDPETRRDHCGEFRYVAIAAWRNRAAKQANRGIVREVNGRLIKAELFNDFKVRLRNPDDREVQRCIERYMHRASNLKYEGDLRGTTLNLQVNDSNNDSYQDNFAMNTANAEVVVVSDSNAAFRKSGGCVFTNVTIAQGSTISSATLTVDVGSTLVDDVNCTIYMEDEDDSVSFVFTDINSRARTTASTSWVADGVGTGLVTSPGFASAVEEVVTRAGWASGNDVCVLLIPNTDVNKQFNFDSYDGDPTNAPKLDIDYTAPASGTANAFTGKFGRPLTGKL